MAESPLFSDSIDDNLNTMRELIGNMPESAQRRARQVADKLVKIVEDARRDAPNDPATGIGVCWAAHFIAQHMTKDDRKLIQLLS